MFVHYRAQGFVFKKIDRGEADQIFTIYTNDFGKLNFLARAVRKISSKLRGGLALFTLSEIEFIQGKAYKTITDAVCIGAFNRIPRSLTKLKIAYKIGEVLDNLIKEEEKNKTIWRLINLTLKELNGSFLIRGKSKSSQQFPLTTHCLLLYYYFFWNLVVLVGFGPSLHHCVSCQQKITSEPIYFDSAQGGVVCKNCFRKFKSGQKVDADSVKILRIILEKDWKEFAKIKVCPSYLKGLKSVSDSYYSHLQMLGCGVN